MSKAAEQRQQQQQRADDFDSEAFERHLQDEWRVRAAQRACGADARAIDAADLALGESTEGVIAADDADGARYWLARYCDRLGFCPAPIALDARQQLRNLRDHGSSEAGILYDILGDRYPLPAYSDRVVDLACKFAVWFVTEQTERCQTTAGGARNAKAQDAFLQGAQRANIAELFLRCLGAVRKCNYTPLGSHPRLEGAALLWRRLLDLGGLDGISTAAPELK